MLTDVGGNQYRPYIRLILGQGCISFTTFFVELTMEDSEIRFHVSETFDDPNPLVLNGSSITSFSSSGSRESDVQELIKREEKNLEQLKVEEGRANTKKTCQLMNKLDAEKELEMLQKKVASLSEEKKQKEREFQEVKDSYMKKINKQKQCNSDTNKRIAELKDTIRKKRQICEEQKREFLIKAKLNQKNVRYIRKDRDISCDHSDDALCSIQCSFFITPLHAFSVKGGQALITFEEESVAEKILKMRKHEVSLDDGRMAVKALPVKLDVAAKFEISMDISRKKVKVDGIPDLPVGQEKDKLELNFYKPSRGGGEIENIEYDRETGSAIITFAEAGIAERLSSQEEYKLNINGECHSVRVSSCKEVQLEKFQTFSGTSKKTVLLSEIKDLGDSEDLQDMIEIHFQKPSNYGGEVEAIKFVPQEKSATVYFEEDVDVA
ncbi:N-myc-interactor [Protopterus annectens]|uniref:N-myc-interactor n=1 Tax=Protopterus annectens TaxID=7888 RepID=UPI001CF94811|nr:N-myc-interactor [Protopterus annectens]